MAAIVGEKPFERACPPLSGERLRGCLIEGSVTARSLHDGQIKGKKALLKRLAPPLAPSAGGAERAGAGQLLIRCQVLDWLETEVAMVIEPETFVSPVTGKKGGANEPL